MRLVSDKADRQPGDVDKNGNLLDYAGSTLVRGLLFCTLKQAIKAEVYGWKPINTVMGVCVERYA